MRFVSTYYIKEGMIIGKPVYNKNGSFLLEKGVKLKQEYIDKLTELKVNGVYIDDKLSRDIEARNIVSEEIRMEAIQGIKNMFNHVDTDQNIDLDDQIARIINSLNKIIDKIVDNEDLIVNLADIKILDDYTYSHSVNVAVLSLIMGVALKLNDVQLYELGIGALLHDIGKVFIPDEIINKPARLTDEEMRIVQNHSQLGYEYMKQGSIIPHNSQMAVLDHHEKLDGSGYPYNKVGTEIHQFAKIIAICDVYDAITSKRVYKGAQEPSEALDILTDNADTLFDKNLIHLFKTQIYPISKLLQ